MQKITPNLWFDDQAEEAARFYTSLFEDSSVGDVVRYDKAAAEAAGRPEGSAMIVTFQLAGQEFVGLNGGPHFRFTPAISFFVNFDPSREEDAKEKLDEAWDKLSLGGTVLMPLDTYPFSEHYGWIQDKYGLSWQLILTNPEGEERPPIVPSLMFVGDVCGKAEEAVDFYVSVFKNAKPGSIFRYPAGTEPDKEGTVMFADFMLENQWFAAMDSAGEHKFHFNEAVSFIVNCDTQAEIDYFWDRLSAHPEAEQCGWLKDQFGVSWQIVPTILPKLVQGPDPRKSQQATQAMLQMKKIDIAALEQAYKQG